MNAPALPSIGGNCLGKIANLALPVAIAALAASTAYAGADATFAPALTKFTDFLEGSGGKIITVLSLAGGLIGLASGRFRDRAKRGRAAAMGATIFLVA